MAWSLEPGGAALSQAQWTSPRSSDVSRDTKGQREQHGRRSRVERERGESEGLTVRMRTGEVQRPQQPVTLRVRLIPRAVGSHRGFKRTVTGLVLKGHSGGDVKNEMERDTQMRGNAGSDEGGSGDTEEGLDIESRI